MLITVPLGVGGGIYMAEYAPANKLTDFIRVCIEVLSSLPSIVMGMSDEQDEQERHDQKDKAH